MLSFFFSFNHPATENYVIAKSKTTHFALSMFEIENKCATRSHGHCLKCLLSVKMVLAFDIYICKCTFVYVCVASQSAWGNMQFIS